MMSKAGHVVLLPYPSQGHINPMLELARCIASHGPLVTIALTRFLLNSGIHTVESAAHIKLAPISDGFDRGGFVEAASIDDYLDRFESVGSETLAELIRSEAGAGRRVDAVVFVSFFPWAGDVAKRLGAATAALFTQSCAVDLIYFHLLKKRIEVPVEAEAAVELPGLPRLHPKDLPKYMGGHCPYPAYFTLVRNQYRNWEKVDQMLINSFHDLEPEEADYLAKECGAKTVGPTVPFKSARNLPPSDDSHYRIDLYTPVHAPCMNWLNSMPARSVAYVSFGSMSDLSPEQMLELAHGLSGSGVNILWVVRSSEAHKLPRDFVAAGAGECASGSGLVVSWCPQLDVLAHAAVGCFVSHCGWNSTLEAICSGVPIVGVPQWTDQTTNAKYVEDVWRVGVRAREEAKEEEEEEEEAKEAAGTKKKKKKGVVRREGVERCVKEVMEGERSEEMKRNAKRYSELAKAAAAEGGSSDKNVYHFVSKCCCDKYTTTTTTG